MKFSSSKLEEERFEVTEKSRYKNPLKYKNVKTYRVFCRACVDP